MHEPHFCHLPVNYVSALHVQFMLQPACAIGKRSTRVICFSRHLSACNMITMPKRCCSGNQPNLWPSWESTRLINACCCSSVTLGQGTSHSPDVSTDWRTLHLSTLFCSSAKIWLTCDHHLPVEIRPCKRFALWLSPCCSGISAVSGCYARLWSWANAVLEPSLLLIHCQFWITCLHKGLGVCLGRKGGLRHILCFVRTIPSVMFDGLWRTSLE